MSQTYKPIQPRGRLYLDIVEQVQEMIVSGQLQPGDQLPAERQLAEQFGVSRTAVREAIKSLAERGLVDILVGRGTFVTSPTHEHVVESLTLLLRVEASPIEDLQAARTLVEVPVAGLAAQHRTEAHLEALAARLAEMEASLDDVERFVEADTAFHVEMARATGNAALVLLTRALTALIQKERTFMLHFHEQELRAAIDSHRQLLDAVRAGDAGATRRAMQAHLDRVGDRLEAIDPATARPAATGT